jgi:hypothetical protein
VQFALLEPEKVGAAIRSRPLQPIRSRRTLFPSPRSRGPGAVPLLPARRRLSAPWMLTPRTPSFHVGAGRAFTENDPTSDAPLSLRSTGTSAPNFRRPALAPHATLECAKSSVTARARIVPPSPRTRAICFEPDDRHEKMEERLKAPSVVSDTLRASAHARGLSATRTQRLAAPDRANASCLLFDNLARCLRISSLGTLAFPSASAERVSACAPHHSAQSNPSG